MKKDMDALDLIKKLLINIVRKVKNVYEAFSRFIKAPETTSLSSGHMNVLFVLRDARTYEDPIWNSMELQN